MHLVYVASLALKRISNEFAVALSCFVMCSLVLAFGYLLVVAVLVFSRLSRRSVKAIVRLLVAIRVFGSFLIAATITRMAVSRDAVIQIDVFIAYTSGSQCSR